MRRARILDGLGVSIDPDAPVRSLRLAQQQMVEVARALSDEARILVMDEPTSALSEREVAQLFETIERLTAGGVAVVYISHRMEEVFRIGHRVTVLRDGCHVATRDIADVTVPQLVRLMANRDVSDHYPRRAHARGEELLRVERLGSGALEDISFVLRRGEILGIAGLVGAGRTRLARAIVGADRVDAAASSFAGRRSGSARRPMRRAPGSGSCRRIASSRDWSCGLAVERNVSISHLRALSGSASSTAGGSGARRQQAIADLRIRTPGPDQLVLNLSGGNQQKVVLAKWLAARADILIFDEPTRGIDVAARQDIYLLMNRLVEEGAGLIMISSDLPEVLGMSDRILVMRGGARRRSSPPRGHRGRGPAGRARGRLVTTAVALDEPPAAARSCASRRQLGTFAGLLALCVMLWAATPHFLTVSNLLNVLEQTALNAIVAMGMTFVIISGGIDLSVGSVLAVAGHRPGAARFRAGVPAPVAIAIALALGLSCGLINGVLDHRSAGCRPSSRRSA